MQSDLAPRGARFGVQRRTSVRRPWHSTIDTKRLPEPNLPSPGCSQCTPRYVPVLPHPLHNDRTIPAARMAGPCERGSDWLPGPSSLSAIEVRDLPAVSAESKRARGCSLLRRRVGRRVPFRRLDGEPLRPSQPLPGASSTLVQAGWCPDSGPSTRRLDLRTACMRVDIALAAGFRADAMSRTARRLPDRRAAGALWMHSWKRCAITTGILSVAARRTEVRRCTLKRAPRGTGERE